MIRHVGVIGLGTIGRPIAERVLAAGYPVGVYDIRPDPVAELARAGAHACASAAEVARWSELVISLVLDSTALQAKGDLGPRWKNMLQATPPAQTPPNLRKDTHAALELARQLGVLLFLGSQAALIADSGFATGHDNPAL